MVSRFLIPRHALLREAPAFFPVSVFALLLASIWISPLSLFCVKPPSDGISSSPIAVSVWACGAALISMKRWARASRAAQASALPLPLRQIFSPALLCQGAGIPVRFAIRYRRSSTLLLLPLLSGLVSAIFFLSEKGPFSFATLRLPILRAGSRLVLFPVLQKPGVFFPICSSTLLLSGSEIFLVSETAKHGMRFARIHPP